MPEILTESFCERCGTRYTFESAAPKVARLKGIRTVSRGLKNFVMSDDTSMDEAFAAARNETDREVTSQQLDAFHKTFNFCMSCRQYTCGNCWNEVEGRCLSCAPHLGHEFLPGAFAESAGGALIAEPNGHGTNGYGEAAPIDAMAWPTADLMREDVAAAEAEARAAAEAEARAAAEAQAAAEAEAARLEAEAAAEAAAAARAAAEAQAAAEAEAAEAARREAEAAAAARAAAEAEVAAAAKREAEAAAAAEFEAAEARRRAEAEAAAQAEAARREAEAAALAEFEAAEARRQAQAAAAAEAEAIKLREEAARAAEAEAARRAAQAAALAEFEAAEARREAEAAAAAEARRQAEEAAAAEAAAAEARRQAEVAAAAEAQRQAAEAAAAAEAARVQAEAAAAAAAAEAARIEAEAVAAAVAAEAARREAEVAAAVEAARLRDEAEAAAAAEAARRDAEAAAIAEPQVGIPTTVEPEDVDDRAAAAAAQTFDLLQRLRPGQSLDGEWPVADNGLGGETRQPPAAAGPESTSDVVSQPTWQITAPDGTPDASAPTAPSGPGGSPVEAPADAVAASATPQWPAQPEWPSDRPAAGLPFLGRPATPTGGIEALWAESAREVATAATGGPAARATGGVQPCISCGLSLSATARFCRRCGTAQS